MSLILLLLFYHHHELYEHLEYGYILSCDLKKNKF
jgi:hypothetical protein